MIIVHNQQELNDVPFGEDIQVESSPETPLVCTSNIRSARVEGDSVITFYDVKEVHATDQATVVIYTGVAYARDNARIFAFGKAHGILFDAATGQFYNSSLCTGNNESAAVLRNEAEGQFFNNSKVWVRDTASASLFDSAKGDFSDETLGSLYNQSNGYASDSAQLSSEDESVSTLRNNASLIMRANTDSETSPRAEAYDFASVVARGTSRAMLFDESTGEGYDRAHFVGADDMITLYDQATREDFAPLEDEYDQEEYHTGDFTDDGLDLSDVATEDGEIVAEEPPEESPVSSGLSTFDALLAGARKVEFAEIPQKEPAEVNSPVTTIDTSEIEAETYTPITDGFPFNPRELVFTKPDGQ